MEETQLLTDEEIKDILLKMGIIHKTELDSAIMEYKKYWDSVCKDKMGRRYMQVELMCN